ISKSKAKRLATSQSATPPKPTFSNPKPLKELVCKDKAADCIDLSPDGKWIALATGSFNASGDVHLWETTSGKELPPLRIGKWMRCVAFTSDGKKLFSASNSGQIQAWDVATWEELGR